LIIIYTVFGEDLRAKFIDKFGDSYQHFWSRTFGRLTHLVVGLTVGIVLFTLPTGYLRNIQLFGHPIETYCIKTPICGTCRNIEKPYQTRLT
jgi:hypothetical protein